MRIPALSSSFVTSVCPKPLRGRFPFRPSAVRPSAVRWSAEDELDVLVDAELHDGDQLTGVIHASSENGVVAVVVLPLTDDCFQARQHGRASGGRELTVVIRMSE
ncbi:hypothetical protein ACFYQ5_35080 [Streptomyces sp. NPDC005794]|uniref:hypothetical protein n=1 Tax=Streptomyces sp. NPDC005794 TaxID=3364733 RepID=UPI0036ABAE29